VSSIAFDLEVYDEHGKKRAVSDLQGLYTLLLCSNVRSLISQTNIGKGIEFDIIVTLPESLASEVYTYFLKISGVGNNNYHHF